MATAIRTPRSKLVPISKYLTLLYIYAKLCHASRTQLSLHPIPQRIPRGSLAEGETDFAPASDDRQAGAARTEPHDTAPGDTEAQQAQARIAAEPEPKRFGA
jgi:hypothetical protein